MSDPVGLDPKALAAARHAEYEEWRAGRGREVARPDPLAAGIRAYLETLDSFAVAGSERRETDG